jgi:hypothetical protein
MHKIDALLADCRAGPLAHYQLDRLITHSGNARVGDFLLDVIDDPNQNFTLRIGAIRVFGFGSVNRRNQRRLRESLLRIITAEKVPDPLLREHALCSVEIHGYGDRPEVVKVLLAVLSDPQKPANYRLAALGAIATSGKWPEREPIVRGLVDDADPNVANRARHLLSERSSKRQA